MTEMLGIQPTADKYNMSYYAVRHLALSGTVPAIRIGRGKILINQAGFEEYLNNARLTDSKDDEQSEPPTVNGIRMIGR